MLSQDGQVVLTSLLPALYMCSEVHSAVASGSEYCVERKLRWEAARLGGGRREKREVVRWWSLSRSR